MALCLKLVLAAVVLEAAVAVQQMPVVKVVAELHPAVAVAVAGEQDLLEIQKPVEQAARVETVKLLLEVGNQNV
jgi:hypothetical protein